MKTNPLSHDARRVPTNTRGALAFVLALATLSIAALSACCDPACQGDVIKLDGTREPISSCVDYNCSVLDDGGTPAHDDTWHGYCDPTDAGSLNDGGL